MKSPSVNTCDCLLSDLFSFCFSEIKHLNAEWSQSLDKIEHLELQVAELLNLQDIKIEQSTNVELKSNQRQLNPGDSDDAAASLKSKGEIMILSVRQIKTLKFKCSTYSNEHETFKQTD